ncbi:MAG: hypothetical protein ABFD24_09415 [Anaerolineaceae bacterium]|jgi:hypothetical protein
MALLVQVVVFIILVILQLAVVSAVPLLHGMADILLVWVAAWALLSRGRSAWVYALAAATSTAFVSAIHPIVPFVSYFLVVLLARFFQNRIWQSPFMALIIVSFAGSLLQSLISYIALTISGVGLDFQTSLVQVIIPTLFLNLLMALPVYAICKDLHRSLYPYEVEI